MDAPAPKPAPTMNGLVLLGLCVAAGMGYGAAYWHWKAPPEIARLRKLQDDLPDEPEPRLDAWLVFGAPMVHGRLGHLRLAPGQPWLATHVVEGAAGEPPELWGVDFADLPQDLCVREGLTVRLRLPPAQLLARAEPRGDNAVRVPRFAAGAEVPDPDERAAQLVEWALRHPDDFIARLEKEIPGATLVVEGGTYPEPAEGERP